MRLASCDSISIKTRHRQEFSEDRLTELADSIHRNGLLHLPVVRSEEDYLLLVSGERRLRAIKKLHAEGLTVRYLNQVIEAGMCPFALYEDLTPDQAFEVELEENIIRVDLTWQERLQAFEALCRLRESKGEPTVIAGDSGFIGHADKVSDKRALFANLHRDSVRGAKTEREALKILQTEVIQELETALGKKIAAAPGLDRHHVLLGSFADHMNLYKGKVNVFCCDPPYGIDAHQFSHAIGSREAMDMTQMHTYDDSWSSVGAMLASFASLAYQTAADEAHLYMFCDVGHFQELHWDFEEAGWDVWRTPLVWHHPNQVTMHRPGYGPGRSYEIILYAVKGNKPVRENKSDVIVLPSLHGDDKIYGAAKPPALYHDLLSRSATPGELVMDPFCGSGPIFPAANELLLTAIGMDIDPRAVAIASGRLNERIG